MPAEVAASQNPIRLALVDDHPTLLNGLAAIFQTDPGYHIVATGGAAEDAERIARDDRPDVMLLDLSMPGDIFAAIARMTRVSPALKLVVFTAFANVDLALRALDAGALGFVLKGRPSNDLFDAIESVCLGELYVSPEFSPALLRGFRNKQRPRATGFPLTVREEQLVDYLVAGASDSEVARAMRLTDKLLGHYMTGLLRKLDAGSRSEALSIARRLRT